MLVHRLAAQARRWLPARAFQMARAAGNLLLTPALFSYYTGHGRSALCGRPVDRHGRPVPWYTYPANNFLEAKDLRGRRVLEFGAGQSTLWWAGRAAEVIAFDADPAWCAYLRPRLPDNVILHQATDFPALEAVLEGQRFDIIVIDGLDVEGLGRLGCARRARRWHAEGGAILLDNSEGSWSPDGRFLIMDQFRADGFSRVDFYGWGPGNVAPACTSLFFRGPCFLLRGDENPIKPYPLAQQE